MLPAVGTVDVPAAWYVPCLLAGKTVKSLLYWVPVAVLVVGAIPHALSYRVGNANDGHEVDKPGRERIWHLVCWYAAMVAGPREQYLVIDTPPVVCHVTSSGLL